MSQTRKLILLAVLVGILGLVMALQQLSAAIARPSAHPLVLTGESYHRAAFGQYQRRRLNLGRFDELEALADTLRQEGFAYPGGTPGIATFYEDGFGNVDVNDAAHWQRHLDRLREWTETHPNSITARVALAEGLIGRAWAARGGGWASDVADERLQRFANDLSEAALMLGQCPPEARGDATWYRARMQALHGLGSRRDAEYRELFGEAVASFPSDSRFYVGMAGHLMPRWYGAPGDWERFATEVDTAGGDSLGHEMYARILVAQNVYATNIFTESQGLSWVRARDGIEAWERRCPRSIQPRSALAMLAWEAGDRDRARAAFAAIGDTVELDVWRSVTRFSQARRWAREGDKLATR